MLAFLVEQQLDDLWCGDDVEFFGVELMCFVQDFVQDFVGYVVCCFDFVCILVVWVGFV